MIDRTITVKLEAANQLSLTLFSGEEYLIDLSKFGMTGNIRSENFFQDLLKILDEHVYDVIVMMNLQPKINLKTKQSNITRL